MNNAPFKVGQKVLCIELKHDDRRNCILSEEIKKGHVYTVSKTGLKHLPFYGPYQYVIVDGMITKWDLKSFAPIDETKERIRYVAVSETLREQAVEVAAIETN